MVKGEGSVRIDGVAVGEITINLLSPTVHLAARYAFTNSLTAERFGSGNRNSNWSSTTLEKLGELVESMEKDLCQEMFTGGVTATEGPTDGVAGDALPNLSADDGIPSL